jgi:hypothetical protein
MGLFRIRSALATLALVLTLLPFLALSMVAQGVMPQQSATGTLTLVLCSPEGDRSVTLDLATGAEIATPATDHQSDRGRHPCAFATADAPALTGVPFVLPLPASVTFAAHLPQAGLPTLSVQRFLVSPPRGPPAIL